MPILLFLRTIVGIWFGVTIFISSIFGNYIIASLLPILFVFNDHHLWRYVVDRSIAFWIFIPVTILQFIFGVKCTVAGDLIERNKPALIIMNHRTRLDWLYYWIALVKINPWLLVSSKIALKWELKNLPGIGIGMASNQFIFLKRKIDEDKITLDESVDYFSNIGFNYQILFFPEGTDKSEWTTRKSHEFAVKNALPQLNYLIYPRSAGLAYLIRRMRKCEYLSCIYNVTVAYPKNIVQSEIDLVLKGSAPKRVHFDVERIDMETIPTDEDGIATWINQIWLEKDVLLEEFYTQQNYLNFGAKRRHSSFIWPESDDPLHLMAKLTIFCFWMSVQCIWLYHMTFLFSVQVGMIISLLIFTIIQYKYGGVNRMVYHLWKKSIKKSAGI